jgi:hypothetical protein
VAFREAKGLKIFVSIAVGDRNLAAGLGYMPPSCPSTTTSSSPVATWSSPKDTRIEIETTPLRAPILKPQGQ